MKQQAGQHIVILGCGNVAWHLASHFQSVPNFSVSVYNHAPNPALKAFQSKLKCATGVGFQKVPGDADVYFICVSDKFIANTAAQLNITNKNAIVLHTSGSAELSELGSSGYYGTGVFYPLQTFSKQAKINWKEIPLILEASGKAAERKLVALAKQVSNTYQIPNYKTRLKLHLAAVFANNFTNALYVAAASLVDEKSQNNIHLLLPLIQQTTQKLETLSPLEAQTGPAKRGDTVVLKKHKKILSGQKELKKIYTQLSKLIAHQQKQQHA